MDVLNTDERSYLLATSGNDSLVKLWRITIYKENKIATASGATTRSNDGNVHYEEKKTLSGHGGNVTCVRFSPTQGEILGSVATDRTARIWSAVSESSTTFPCPFPLMLLSFFSLRPPKTDTPRVLLQQDLLPIFDCVYVFIYSCVSIFVYCFLSYGKNCDFSIPELAYTYWKSTKVL